MARAPESSRGQAAGNDVTALLAQPAAEHGTGAEADGAVQPIVSAKPEGDTNKRSSQDRIRACVEDGHAITARTNGDASGVSNVSAAPPVVHNSPSPGQAAAGEDAVHAQVRKPLHPPMDGVCP